MCGITGIYDIKSKYTIERETIVAMTEAIKHRGPDESSYLLEDNFGLGFKRLSIIDLKNGHQPFFNHDQSVILICNGEIYNYRELRKELEEKGYPFKTNCDVECIVYLYEEYGTDFIERLNGQFAFTIIDKKKKLLLLARDQFGICPLFYTILDDVLIFGSEIKAILKHPSVRREVDLTGLDQVFTFPGLVSPSTLFKNIKSLKAGHFLLVKDGGVSTTEFWDLNYPEENGHESKPEAYYAEGLEEQLLKSVKYRLNSDVPVGFYLSGGLDSSIIAGMMKKLNSSVSYQSFSIGFPEVSDVEYDERKYQRLVARNVNSQHNEIPFNWSSVDSKLREAVLHAECPLKETYNTCSLALSKAVKNNGIKVILSGEGSDEFLGGYVGYRFDVQRRQINHDKDINDILEEEMRKKLWGDPNFTYERNELEFIETKKALYSESLNKSYREFDCLRHLEIDKKKLMNRHVFHKRSYLDLKLRLSDHLVSDHCDRVNYANSVEGRYPFLDIELLDFIKTIPPGIKLKGLTEKYILKMAAKKYVPDEIVNRQKFSFVAPGSPQLLKNNIEWIEDILSYETIKRQGYFNPDTIERLKKMYRKENFRLNLPFDPDLLIIVITFGLFLEIFDMPNA
jgi:asparagine synthase (glutamine-hydrolysing)